MLAFDAAITLVLSITTLTSGATISAFWCQTVASDYISPERNLAVTINVGAHLATLKQQVGGFTLDTS